MSLTRVSSIVSELPSDNIAINGDFNLWSRGNSFTISGTTRKFLSDRIALDINLATAQFTADQSTVLPTFTQSGHNSNYCLNVAVSTGQTSLATGEWAALVYGIEGYHIHELNNDNFTIGFWIRSNKTGIFSLAARNSIYDRSYVTEITINSANVFEKKFVTIPLDIATIGGTWDLLNGKGLSLTLTLGVGSGLRTTTLDQWQSGNFIASDNQVNFMDAANSLYLSQFQVAKGVYLPPFPERRFEIEELLARRYFWEYATSAYWAESVVRTTGASLVTSRFRRFPVPMRATPSVTEVNNGSFFYLLTTTGVSTGGVAGASSASCTREGFRISETVSGIAVGATFTMVANNPPPKYWFDAEI